MKADASLLVLSVTSQKTTTRAQNVPLHAVLASDYQITALPVQISIFMSIVA